MGVGTPSERIITPISTIHMRLWAQAFLDVVVAYGMRRERAKGWGGDSISQPRRRDAGGSSIHLNRGTGHHGTAARTNTDTRSARRMSRCPSSQRYETRRLDDDGVRLTDRCKTFLGHRDGPGTIIYRFMWR